MSEIQSYFVVNDTLKGKSSEMSEFETQKLKIKLPQINRKK